MKILENGKVILEQGEKAFNAVLLGVDHVHGISKDKGKEYDFVKVRLDLQCQIPSTGEIVTKTDEPFADKDTLDYLNGFEKYQPCIAIYSIGFDPTAKNCVRFVGLAHTENLKA